MSRYWEFHVEYFGRTLHIEVHDNLGDASKRWKMLCHNFAMHGFDVYAYVIRPNQPRYQLDHFTV